MMTPYTRPHSGCFTHDGIELDAPMELSFGAPYMGRVSGFSLGFGGVEYNTKDGVRRPYVYVYLGFWEFQVGWLWGTRPAGTAGEEA